LIKTHSLERLLNWLVDRLALISAEEIDEKILKTIIQFHNMDSDGQTFRYPFKKDGKLTLPDKRRYDIENILIQMEEVENYLSGIHAWLDEGIQLGLELWQERWDEISSLQSDFY
jgi:hypothetical protein